MEIIANGCEARLKQCGYAQSPSCSQEGFGGDPIRARVTV